jgi:predicted Ser/Thr protein kinase
MSIDTLLGRLSEMQRKIVEARLTEFKRLWNEIRLQAELRDLPPRGDLMRVPIYVGLVLSDLRQRWKRGQTPTVESYLPSCPELGDRDSVPVALIVAEFEARRSARAPADVEDFARRFPRQAPELRQRVAKLAANPPGSSARQQPVPPPPASAASASAASTDTLPEQFGRYRIQRTLGRGSMGTVYLAEDTNLGRRVAIKVPRFTAEDGPEIRARFFREARTAATLEHPNICPAYDSGDINGVLYMTMAYIEGKTLTEVVAQGNVTQQQAAVLVGKLALALAEAHSRQIIHRDLKPSNILINTRGEPILMDFGLARKIDQTDERLTQPGAVLGTPAYMAPEQVTGNVDAHGTKTDIYSLGAVLYHALTGQAPFTGAVTRVFYQVIHQQPRPIASVRPGVHADLEAICFKAMAKKPDERFATMSEFAAAIFKHLRDQAGADAPPAAAAERAKEPAAQPAAVAPPAVPQPAEPRVGATGSTDRHKRVAVEEPKKLEVPERSPNGAAARERPSDPPVVPFWVWLALVGIVAAGVVGFGTWFVLRNG